MKIHMRKSIGLLAGLPALLLATSQLSAGEQADITAQDFWFDTQGTLVDVVTPFEFESIELRVRKRGETEVWTETFGPGVSLSVDLAHVVETGLTDNRYTYELRFVTGQKPIQSEGMATGSSEEPVSFSSSGSFSVEDGSITDVSIPGYQPPGNSKGGNGTIQSDSNLEASGDPTLMDVVDAGELAIGGWGVFGSSNTNDVVDGKLRVLASPTGIASVSVQSEATNGDDYAWHFGVEDGGDFGLQRQRTTSGAKTTVLGIEEDASANSLMIDSTGQIGMGTATPVEKLHIATGGASIVALERTGSFPNTWYLSSSQSWFSVGESASSGNNHPFSIRAGAPGSALVVGSSGDVGVGTASPIRQLDVDGADSATGSANTVALRVANSSGTTAGREMMRLENNGDVRFIMNTSGEIWTFSAQSGSFVINSLNSGDVPMRVFTNGNMLISGTLTENSSRAVKHDISALDGNDVLAKLSELEISKWRYNSNPEAQHIGPMAEDWHAQFGLGETNKGVAPRDLAGVALAAAKALQSENFSLKSISEQLQSENAALESRLTRLEEQLEMLRVR